MSAPDRMGERAGFDRAAVYRGRLDPDGALLDQSMVGRLGRWLSALLATAPAREEQELDRRLRSQQRGLTRPNYIAVASPKGGVGKTTCSLLVGDLLAGALRLRCVAVDANPDYGTLGSLAPDDLQSGRSLADLLSALGELDAAAAIRPYVSPLPSGLHLLAAPSDARAMADLSAEDYRRLTDALARFYELIVLDLGTGLTDPLARFALGLADQAVLVATPEWVTAERVLAAVADLSGTVEPARTTLVLNQTPARQTADRQVIEAAFRRAEVAQRIAIPYDPQLRAMLDAGAYRLENLTRPTRIAVKRLGLAVAEGLE